MNSLHLKREFERSYIVTEYNVSKENEYQVSMITENHIEGLLDSHIEFDQYKKYISYEVTNKMSLTTEYAERSISIKDIKRIFTEISVILNKGNEYLLDSAFYEMNPDYIYKDMETDKIQLAYIPCDTVAETDNANQYGELADFLLRKVNSNDEAAVKIAYLFYKMIKMDTFSFSMFISLIEKEEAVTKSEHEKECCSDEETQNETEDVSNEPHKPYAVYCIPVIVCAITEVGLSITYFIMRDKFGYASYLLIGLIIVGIILLYLILKTVISVLKNREQNIEFDENVTVEEYWGDEETQLFTEETQMFDEETQIFNEGEDSDLGNTVYKLYWKEKNTEKKYRIRSFPLTVGKLGSSSVDCRINDVSVSRIHAQILCKNKKIYITDMNSSNGTYVDGRKLLVGEEAEIDAKSLIRLGNMIIGFDVC